MKNLRDSGHKLSANPEPAGNRLLWRVSGLQTPAAVLYHPAMPPSNRMKGISRIDQPEKHTHGFFVRMARQGKTHSAFFSDKTIGGRDQALAAAEAHYQQLLKTYGAPRRPFRLPDVEEAINTGRNRKRESPSGLTIEQMSRVQCHGFRCIAYQDVKGRWINFYTGKLLHGLVKVIKSPF